MRLRLGLAIVALLVGCALLSPLWTPWPVEALDIAHRLAPPSLAHPLGTDHLGRDLVSLLMAGAAPALLVALAGVGIGLAFGVPLGLLAAARPGPVDEAVSRTGDVLFAFPAILFALLLVALLGPGADKAALAVGLFNVPVFLRLTRGAARGTWARDFILAARLAGKGPLLISVEHVLPNIAAGLAVQATAQLGIALGAEAALSYLGLGVQPPGASWGRMIADGQTLIESAPRLVLAPAGALLVAVTGLTLLAAGLRGRK